MMICQQCGKQNDPDAAFCVQCSHPLSQPCPNCKTQNAADAHFCKKCGEALDEVPASAQSIRLKALRESASASLQEKLRQAETEIEGQRKPITILFTDIVSSTAIAEKLDPEEWKEVVQGAHQLVSEAVHRYEGTIAQLLGDGVLAFFGAPLTHEDDPERAVRAALDLQESLQDYRKTLTGFVDAFHMRVGIHSGEVVVGRVGAEGHSEYLAIGDAVNIAARLEQASEPDQVLISQACARFVEYAFDIGEYESIQAKGKSEPVRAAIVLGLKAKPGLARGIGGMRTSFVGREPELAQLEEALQSLCQGQGRIIIVTGDAGIGKSRLLEQVRESSYEAKSDAGEVHFDPKTIRWLEGRALSYGGALSFWMIHQLLLADLDLSDGTSQVKIKAALRARLKVLFGEPESQVVLPYLSHLMDIKLGEQEGGAIKDMDGEAIKYQALLYLGQYFDRAAAEAPTVLVFEDMHWADPSSLEALKQLIPLADHVPLLFILLMRIEREHGSWVLKTAIENDFPHRTNEIELRRLGDQESQMLIEQLLRPEVIPENVRQLILTRSEGNPFYLEEVVRHLLETGLVVERDGEWVAAEGLAEMGVPETLQGVLLARIDRLEDDVRDTLQMAAVIGKSFLYKLLEAISEAERALETHLSQLQRMDLVREKARLPELEYIFKHSLTQEAAYNSLLIERRKAFHRKIGVSLEELFPDREEEFLGLLAHHFQAAGEMEKASDYLIRAGDKARMADAHDEAVILYNHAMPLLEKLNDQRRAYSLWLRIGLSHLINFRFNAANKAYEEASNIQSICDDAQAEYSQPKDLHLPADPNQMKTLDPGKDAFVNLILPGLFLGLSRITPGINIEPHAARCWEVLDDGTRYVFNLRDDLKWSNGKTIAAKDFEWTWFRNMSPDTGSPYAHIFDSIVGARAFRMGENKNKESVGIRALDDHTLEVRLNAPSSNFLYITALPVTFALPRTTIEDFGDAWWHPGNIVCAGPFIPEQLNQDIKVFVKNDSYSLPFSGNLGRIIFKTIGGQTQQEELENGLSMYRAREVDYLLIDPLNVTDDIPEEEIHQSHSLFELLVQYAIFNPTLSPTSNIHFRKAIIQGTDLARHIDIFHLSPASGGLIHPSIPGHSPTLGYSYDLETANKHLVESHFPKEKDRPKIQIGVPAGSIDWREGAKALQSQWETNLGIQSQLSEYDLLSDEYTSHIYLGGWFPDYPAPDSYFDAMQVRTLIEEGGLSNLNQLLNHVNMSIDRKERLNICREIDRILVQEECLVFPLFYASFPTFSHLYKPNLKNANLDFPAFENVVIE